jgi:hypothetical protein
VKYRKKPVVIEAILWSGDNELEVAAFFGQSDTFGLHDDTNVWTIQTLEGEMTAKVGDWIIKGVKGEFYPCKPDIFDATYEPVEETKP